MAVSAVQAIRKMRGGSQSLLMLADDESLWVVKFRNNPQHRRILINEFVATRLAALIGLTVPDTDVVEVDPWLVANEYSLCYEYGKGRREAYAPGLHFGSRYVGGLMPGCVVDYLPDEQLSSVRNLEEFAGILCLDKWTGNTDYRQAVFSRMPRQRAYKAHFIDQGWCFGANAWAFPDAPLSGTYVRNRVYSSVVGWESFEPWLSRIEQISDDAVRTIANDVPLDWYKADSAEFDRVTEQVLTRRMRIRELIHAFRYSARSPFPMWSSSMKRADAQGTGSTS